jgi:hypothetical protein
MMQFPAIGPAQRHLASGSASTSPLGPISEYRQRSRRTWLRWSWFGESQPYSDAGWLDGCRKTLAIGCSRREGENETLGQRGEADGGFLAQGEPRGSILRIALRKQGRCAPQQLLKTLWIDAVGY